MSNEIMATKPKDEINLIIRTADQTRKAEVTVPMKMHCSEIISGAIDNWSLDKTVDYTVSNVSNGIALDPDHTIEKSGISDGDMLEIQPVLVAGYEC
jgi:hypothetical protein